MRKFSLLFLLVSLFLGGIGAYAARIQDVKLKIYNQEEGEFNETDYEFHFNEFGPFLFEVVLTPDEDLSYYTNKNGLEITVKIGKRTVFKKTYPVLVMSDEFYYPVFIDESVICEPVTVIARIKGKKGSAFEKKFEFACGE